MFVQQNNISERKFLVQMIATIHTFGQEIPWLHAIKDTIWYTKPSVFREKILKGLNLEENQIQPFSLLDSNTQHIGSVIHFTKSPESFYDPALRYVQQELEIDGFSYLTCLHVREPFQKNGSGKKIMLDVFASLQDKFAKIWGVVSHRELVPYYQSLGFLVHTTNKNKDGLWIITRE